MGSPHIKSWLKNQTVTRRKHGERKTLADPEKSKTRQTTLLKSWDMAKTQSGSQQLGRGDICRNITTSLQSNYKSILIPGTCCTS